MLRFGVSRKAVLKALIADRPTEEPALTALARPAVSELMRAAGLAQEWQDFSKYEREPQGSPWLTERAAELYAQGLADVHVVADLMDIDADSAREELAALGWAPGTADLSL
jgi:hypothetical protein